MELELCSFKLAKKLKEVGFASGKGWCMWYDEKGEEYLPFSSNPEDYYTKFQAPSLELAKKWFLEKHKIFIDIYTIDDWDHWGFKIMEEDCMSPFFISYDSEHSDFEWNTYDEALEAGLTQAIELIKENK